MDRPKTVLLTVHDVAKRMSVSESLVYQLVESGRLPCHRLGNGRGTIRVSEIDLESYLAECREAPGPKAPKPRMRHAKLRHLHR